MNHHNLSNEDFQIEDISIENLSNEELAKIRSTQIKKLLDVVKKDKEKLEDFGMLLFLTSSLRDVTKVEKYYFPETTEIAKVFTSAMKKLKCESTLDERAKSILSQAFTELKIEHTISDEVFEILDSVRLEYLHKN